MLFTRRIGEYTPFKCAKDSGGLKSTACTPRAVRRRRQLRTERDVAGEPEDHGDHLDGGDHEVVCEAGEEDRGGAEVRDSHEACPAA